MLWNLRDPILGENNDKHVILISETNFVRNIIFGAFIWQQN
jgi:hypothetical protein